MAKSSSKFQTITIVGTRAAASHSLGQSMNSTGIMREKHWLRIQSWSQCGKGVTPFRSADQWSTPTSTIYHGHTPAYVRREHHLQPCAQGVRCTLWFIVVVGPIPESCTFHQPRFGGRRESCSYSTARLPGSMGRPVLRGTWSAPRARVARWERCPMPAERP